MEISTGSCRPPQALLVSDNPATIVLCSAYLRRMRYEAHVRTTAAKAHAALDSGHFTFTVLDIDDPLCRTSQLCERLRDTGEAVVQWTACHAQDCPLRQVPAPVLGPPYRFERFSKLDWDALVANFCAGPHPNLGKWPYPEMFFESRAR